MYICRNYDYTWHRVLIPREASSPRETMSEAIVVQVSMPERTCCQGQLWVRWVFHRCWWPEALSPKESVSEVSVPHVSMPQEALSQREIVSVRQVSMPRVASSPRETVNEVIVPHVSMPREANWRPAIVVGEGIEREKIDKRSVRQNEKKKENKNKTMTKARQSKSRNTL